jgi:hypothetical protein
MKNTDSCMKEAPEIDRTLLLKFLIRRYDEILEAGSEKIPVVLQGLSLCGVAHDAKAEMELRKTLYSPHPAYPAKACRDILSRTLADFDANQSFQPDDGTLHTLEEPYCRTVLLSALQENKRLIADKAYEFIPIIRMLGWISLQRYPRLLSEFEKVWESSTDPAEAMRAGQEVLWTAIRHRDNDELNPSEVNPH